MPILFFSSVWSVCAFIINYSDTRAVCIASVIFVSPRETINGYTHLVKQSALRTHYVFTLQGERWCYRGKKALVCDIYLALTLIVKYIDDRIKVEMTESFISL